MITPDFSRYPLNGVVLGSAIDVSSESLFLDVRDEHSKKFEIVKLRLKDLKDEARQGIDSWWSQLVSAEDGKLVFTKYLNQHDPTQVQFIQLDWKSGEKIEMDPPVDFPQNSLTYPHIYDHGTAYYQTVMDFLAVESPLACEYLEWEDKIIISYYLRSDNGFERYLLLLKDGQKVWKVKQDQLMKGFSSGAFFVFQNQLIFIKDLNEVCIYTM